MMAEHCYVAFINCGKLTRFKEPFGICSEATARDDHHCTEASTSDSLMTMYCLSSCANSVPLYLL